MSNTSKRPRRKAADAYPGSTRNESYVYGTAQEYSQVYAWVDRAAIEANLAVHAAYFAAHAADSRLISFFGQGRTAGRFAVLRALYLSNRRLSQNEIAGKLMITSASVTFLIDGLEREGLVERIANEQDRRSTQIELTAAGEEVCQRLVPAMAKLAALFSEGFTEAEKKTLTDLLLRFRHNASLAAIEGFEKLEGA